MWRTTTYYLGVSELRLSTIKPFTGLYLSNLVEDPSELEGFTEFQPLLF